MTTPPVIRTLLNEAAQNTDVQVQLMGGYVRGLFLHGSTLRQVGRFINESLKIVEEHSDRHTTSLIAQKQLLEQLQATMPLSARTR